MSDELYIPIPTGFFGKSYGVKSTRHTSATRIIFRISNEKRNIIKQAVAMIDMTECEFIREVAVTAAKAIIANAKEKEHVPIHPGNGSG